MCSYDDNLNCTFPCFMECAMCKYIISFKLNFSKEKVPSENSIGKLLVMKKWGRPKTIPEALEHVENNDNDDDDDIDNEAYLFAPACEFFITVIFIACFIFLKILHFAHLKSKIIMTMSHKMV